MASSNNDLSLAPSDLQMQNTSTHLTIPATSSSNSTHLTTPATSSSKEDIPMRNLEQPSNDVEEQPSNDVEERAPSNRTVRRVLWGKHVFMITVSAVMNVGFYVRSGTVLRTAGPLALFLSLAILTFLAWGVMQCITEMISIWPVPGALVEFVRVFVDEDLALTVGVAYWFTYSITFAAIIAAIAGDVAMWSVPKGIVGAILLFLVPLVLIGINSLGVRLYGFIELVGGTTKFVLTAAILLICMPLINNSKASASKDQGKLHDQFWKNNITRFDTNAANHWSIAFFIALSVVAFAFVGVEIPAATALEARILPDHANSGGPVDRSVKFSAIWVSIIIGLIYVLGALLIGLDLEWDDPQLARLSWLPLSTSTGGSASTIESSNSRTNSALLPLSTGTGGSASRIESSNSRPNSALLPLSTSTGGSRPNSAFVIAAINSDIPGRQALADFINVCILITALTAANTTLYVASRTLFSFTKGIQANASSPWIIRFLSYFGETNHRRVPMRALTASCCFCWVPFLYLSGFNKPGTTIEALLEVLADMGSVSCITVWAVECVAFLRFYYWFYFETGDDYPYRSHGQPYTAYASLAGCLFILIVADGAALWIGFHPQPFFSGYLSPIFFMILFVSIKVYRGSSWNLVDLSDADTVINNMKTLDYLRLRNTANEEEQAAWYNLWGWFERRDRDNRDT